MRNIGGTQLLPTSLRLLRQTFVLATVLAMASNTHATIWYVDSKNGDDSNGGYGTSDALKTISKALTYVSNGDTINVVGHGTSYPYTERLDAQGIDNLTISAYDVGLGDTVINPTLPIQNAPSAVKFKNCDNLSLDGLHLFPINSNADASVVKFEDCDDLDLDGLDISPLGLAARVLHFVSCTGSLIDCEIDANNTIDRGMSAEYTSISMTDCTIQKGKLWGAWFGTCSDCTITGCTFRDTVGTFADDDTGHGVLGTGPNHNFTFTNCYFLDNADTVTGSLKQWGSGIVWRGNADINERSSTLKLINCEANGNGRQGIQTQWTNGITITNGEYNNNGASGIQIESGSVNVTITGADAIGNCNSHPGEKGIWIDEADDVTLTNCVATDNQFNIGVSQSYDVTITGCTIKDAIQKATSSEYGGMLINSGHHDNLPNTQYTGQPEGGVSFLTVESNTFSGNGTYSKTGDNKGDIWYGIMDKDVLDSECKFQNNTFAIGTGTNATRNYHHWKEGVEFGSHPNHDRLNE